MVTQERTARARRGSLSQDRIVDAAMRLLDGEGESALTFSRLGHELRVTPTAIYRHFSSRDEIIAAIADHLDELSLEGYEPTDEWRADLTDLAVRAWETATGHPAAAAAAMFTVTSGIHELRAVDSVLRALHAAGLRDDVAVSYYRAFVSLFLGVSAAHAVRLSQQGRTLQTAEWTQVYRPTDPTRYPYAEAAKEQLRFTDPSEVYRMHIDMYLDSVAQAPRAGDDRV